MPEQIDISNAGPPTLDHIIGQRQAVEQLRVALAAYWAERAAGRPMTFGGVLMAGPPGVGKSSLARILASELAATLHETLGQTLGMGDDLHAILLECTDDTLLFIDEAEQLSPFAQTTLYKAVEERILLVPRGPMGRSHTRVPLSKFTIVLATNHANGINAPLRERMSHFLHFEFYSTEELAAICRQRASVMRWSVEPEVCDLIATKAKQTPRLAIRLLQSCWRMARAQGSDALTVEHFHRTLELEGLDAELGLDKSEQVYLRALAESDGRARLNLLATRVGQPSRVVSEVIESFLIRKGLVTRTASGRELTDDGWDYVHAATTVANSSGQQGICYACKNDEQQS